MTVFYIAILINRPKIIIKKSLRDLALYIRDHNLEHRVGNAIMIGLDVKPKEIMAELEAELEEIAIKVNNQNIIYFDY